MSDTRSEILKRVRTALHSVPQQEQPADVAIERGYRTASDATQEQWIAQFVERVREYKATVRIVTREGLPAAIAEACAVRGVRRLLAPTDISRDWLPSSIEAPLDEGLSYAQIDARDGVVTGW